MMTSRKEWMARVPRLPFWKQDPGLVPIVKKALAHEPLKPGELQSLRIYMQSWITWTALIPEDAEYLAFIEEILVKGQRHLISRTRERLAEYEIDPF